MKAFPKSPIEEDKLASFLARFARGEVTPPDLIRSHPSGDHPAMRGEWIAYDEADPSYRMKLTDRALDLLRRTGRADAVSVAIMADRTMTPKSKAPEP